MKTVSMWSYLWGGREICIHDVEPELFEKLQPAFDATEGITVWAGRISVDENTVIVFLKRNDGKKEG